ncbi:MAG TPA: PilZ domain-containing protein [Desulfurivibrio alkaliphilus]|uniref:PilZ domain-containing protein n=1 Tax=Desulfurivibrio alkaliphilus TaxID=427923 RepID=A0A7C2TG96_9BACT|nr:PilZ domain-containing protein [Desulfurivibrio alkaliphilus]
MGKELRRSQRIEVGLSVRIIIRDTHSGLTLAEDMGLISDISRHGLRLTVPQAKIDGHHLFYSFHEDEGKSLYLAASEELARGEGLPELLAVRPVWFDRLLTRPGKPFQLGMEYVQKPSREVIEWLQKMMAQQQQPDRWWRRIFSRGEK